MQPEEQRHILPASQRFHAKVAPLRELVQVPCRALRQGGDTQVPQGVTDPLPSLQQLAWPHSSTSRIWPYACPGDGFSIVNSDVLLSVGVSRNSVSKAGGWSPLAPCSMVL